MSQVWPPAPPPSSESGTVPVPALSHNGFRSVPVAFKAGRFTSAPRVVAGAGDSTRLSVGVSAVTGTGFTILISNFSGEPSNASTATWIATAS